MTLRLLAYGPEALLVEVPSVAEVMALADGLRATAPGGVRDIVPAARTVLVRYDAAIVSRAAVAQWVTTVRRRGPAPPVPPRAVTIPVVYDGADLAEVAARTGLTRDGVVSLHHSAEYVCAFGGFAPGFGYLVGLDARLHLPRRSTPRSRVPAGSVGIAAEFSAVYPAASPGGWHLLGRARGAPLWDVERKPPSLVSPGTRVRFVAVQR